MTTRILHTCFANTGYGARCICECLYQGTGSHYHYFALNVPFTDKGIQAVTCRLKGSTAALGRAQFVGILGPVCLLTVSIVVVVVVFLGGEIYIASVFDLPLFLLSPQ